MWQERGVLERRSKKEVEGLKSIASRQADWFVRRAKRKCGAIELVAGQCPGSHQCISRCVK